jgi:hypothetical protein
VRLGRENLPPPPLPDLVGLSDLIVLRGPAATVCSDLRRRRAIKSNCEALNNATVVCRCLLTVYSRAYNKASISHARARKGRSSAHKWFRPVSSGSRMVPMANPVPAGGNRSVAPICRRSASFPWF